MVQTPGLAMMAGAQNPAQQSVSVQNTIHTEAGSKEKEQGARVGRSPASIEFGGPRFDLGSDLEMAEGGAAMAPGDLEGGDEYEQLFPPFR